MLADFFTKPLQGALFHKFRAVIMGWKHIDTLKIPSQSELKERVELSNENENVSSDSGRLTNQNNKVKRVKFKLPPKIIKSTNVIRRTNAHASEFNMSGSDVTMTKL